MDKMRFVQLCAKNANYSQPVMAKALETIIHTIVDLVSVGETVHISGLGEFGSKVQHERVARDVYHNTPVTIPERRVPTFKMSRKFKDQLLAYDRELNDE